MKLRRRNTNCKILPENAICRNCGTQTLGRYCHACGQNIFAGRGRPITQLLGQLLENAFALDNKTIVTLKYLFIRPGFLSAEFRDGHIVRYVQPVKLFWMSTIIFFALLISQFDFGEEMFGKSTQQPTTEQALNIKLPNGKDEDKNQADKIDALLLGSKLKEVVSQYAPYMMFLIIPIFALLLKLFFWRNKFYYMYHLAFAVHFHTFLWLLYSLVIVANILTGDREWPLWVDMVLFCLPGIYLIIALYRFYRPKRKRTAVWKAILIINVYFFVVLFFTFWLVILMTRIFLPEYWT